jgi:hypothetical protein
MTRDELKHLRGLIHTAKAYSHGTLIIETEALERIADAAPVDLSDPSVPLVKRLRQADRGYRVPAKVSAALMAEAADLLSHAPHETGLPW